MFQLDPLEISPEEFEVYVKELLEKEGLMLEGFHTKHLESIKGTDGDYTFDVTARFEALGASFLVLIEGKRYSKPIERELVQILQQKLESVGAQKAMLFSTSLFRSGAINFASSHGIALIHVQNGQLSYETRSLNHRPYIQAWLPKFSSLLVKDEGGDSYSMSRLGETQYPDLSRGSSRKFLIELIERDWKDS